MLGVQLETVVVDGMNSFLIIVFFVVSSQRKNRERCIAFLYLIFILCIKYIIPNVRSILHGRRGEGR